MVQLTTNLNLEPDDPLRVAALCGPFDQNLKHLEGRLGVHIRSRGNLFQVSGPERRVHAASAVLERLYQETEGRSAIEAELVHLFLQESGVETLVAHRAGEGAAPSEADATVIRARRKTIKPRGGNQTDYVRLVRSHDVNFGIGPAGTGKTYLAVACAVEALGKQPRGRACCWCGPPWKPARSSASCPGTWPRRSIPTCAPCTTPSMK